MSTDLRDPEVIGNYIEAVFWVAIGITFFVRGRREPAFGRLPTLAGVVFVLFGLSDVVEAQTGAWWRPLWLLSWKALCLAALAWSYLRYRQIRKRLRQSGPATSSAPAADPAGGS